MRYDRLGCEFCGRMHRVYSKPRNISEISPIGNCECWLECFEWLDECMHMHMTYTDEWPIIQYIGIRKNEYGYNVPDFVNLHSSTAVGGRRKIRQEQHAV